MKDTKDSITQTTIFKPVIRIALALLLFYAVKFIITEPYAILLTHIFPEIPNDVLLFLFKIGSLLITALAALPLFCAAMGYPLKRLFSFFHSASKESPHTLRWILFGLAAVTPMILIECGMVFFGNIDTYSISPGNGLTLLGNILHFVIIMPIVEELMFRGIVLDSLKNYGKISAIIISTLAFSIGHLNIVNLLIALPFGVITGNAAYKTGNIRTSAAMHVTVNLYASVLIPILLSNGHFLIAVISAIVLIGAGIVIKITKN